MVVVVAVMGIVAAALGAAASSGMQAAAKAREIHAARQLLIAYHNAAADRGSFLPGYDRTVGEVALADGRIVTGPPAHRYPFRVAAYFEGSPADALLVNEASRQVDADDAYAVSLSPAFGINYLFVGGDVASDGQTSLPGEVATRPAHGANVLVFASAGRGDGSRTTHGFNLLTPPQIYGPMWTSAPWTPDSRPNNYGHVHARHSGKAACAFLDGSVRLLGIEDLRDMRHWSPRAAATNNRDYRVAPATPTGRR